MKNHKLALTIWLVFNIFLLELLLVTWQENSTNGLFVKCFSIAVFAYAFSFCWDALITHIKDSNEIAGIELAERGSVLQFIDSLTAEVLSSATLWLWLVPVYYVLIRVTFLIFGWLKDGVWNTYTTCDVIPSFCYFQSNAIGLNKIVAWFANNDFGFFLVLLCAICGWIVLKRNEQIESN
jgi:hypothetical protein